MCLFTSGRANQKPNKEIEEKKKGFSSKFQQKKKTFSSAAFKLQPCKRNGGTCNRGTFGHMSASSFFDRAVLINSNTKRRAGLLLFVHPRACSSVLRVVRV